MWAEHPENASPEAWADLRDELDWALAEAASLDLVLAVEPEPGNVVRDARVARTLLDEVGAPNLKIILDAANLIGTAGLARQATIVAEAVDLLGPDVVLAHAKDIDASGKVVAPGRGAIDLPAFVIALAQAGFDGALIAHGFDAGGHGTGRSGDGRAVRRPAMSREDFTTPDGCRLAFDIAGEGPAVLWQHGLGAPFDQPLAVFPDLPVTRITLACRGHEDSDLGPLEDLSIATFARDALALLNHLGIESLAAAGGISLGAGISLRLAAYHPERVQRLILARPAWIDRPSMESQQGYVDAGRYLELHGATAGLALFRSSALFQSVEAASPDNAMSLLSYFVRPRPETTTALLARLPKDWPGVPLSMLGELGQSTLVIGNGEDIVHPLAFARELAELIPGARLEVIPSKTVDPAGYTSAFRAALAEFLAEATR